MPKSPMPSLSARAVAVAGVLCACASAVHPDCPDAGSVGCVGTAWERSLAVRAAARQARALRAPRSLAPHATAGLLHLVVMVMVCGVAHGLYSLCALRSISTVHGTRYAAPSSLPAA